jgi:hypothetical protein
MLSFRNDVEIHILEADYNLALKQIFGKRLLQNCEKFGVLGDLQDDSEKDDQLYEHCCIMK